MLDLTSLVSFFVLGVIGWATYKMYIWPVYLTPLRKIPGPPFESLFYGNYKKFMKEEVNEPQLELAKKYGNIVKYYEIFNQPALLITDTTIVQDITLSHSYDYIKPENILSDSVAFIGRGLALSEGDVHKRQRKMMNPAFTYSNIKNMVPTFTRIASKLVSVITEDTINLGESKIKIAPYLSKATLDIIGLVGFNYEFNTLTSPNELAEAYNAIVIPPTILHFMLGRLAYYFPMVRSIPIEINKNFVNACAVIDRESKNLVKRKLKEADIGELKGDDLLSVLININKTLPIEEKLTDEELKNQIMTFLLAGHETTSTSTSWAIYLLARHPHMQDILREEINKAFPDKSNFNPTFDEINSLEYLNGVVKETLRLHSPVTMIRRTNIKDKVYGNYFIPKYTPIMISTMGLHKSTEIWGPTAAEFDPKRWLDPTLTKNVSNLSFLPFNTGARGCIGNKLALAEFKILLSNLIRNFVFQPTDEGFQSKTRTFASSKPDSHFEFKISRVES
ncbi:cytochrome P450 [Rhizophagus irregularis]|uniref:Cytochrome P450 n=1 Tax=Rhizophagus irregularis TaxID=588596 RepID=A0A2I1GLZ6_9GLOM|nr:cytochrome P450 [Rhizophagus irregularis]